MFGAFTSEILLTRKFGSPIWAASFSPSTSNHSSVASISPGKGGIGALSAGTQLAQEGITCRVLGTKRAEALWSKYNHFHPVTSIQLLDKSEENDSTFCWFATAQSACNAGRGC